MRKLLKSLLVSTLFPTILLAQTEYREGQAHVDADRGIMCLGVDGSGNYVPTNLAGISPGTGVSNLGIAEDANIPEAKVGIVAFCQRNSIPAGSAGSNSDAQVPQCDLDGATFATGAPNTAYYRNIDLDEADVQAGGFVRLTGWYIANTTAAYVYVHFYDATAASVTVGTTTPRLTIPIPASGASNIAFHNVMTFSTALTVAATTNPDGTGAPAANAVIVNLFMK